MTLEVFDALQRTRVLDDVFDIAFIAGGDTYENLAGELGWLDTALARL